METDQETLFSGFTEDDNRYTILLPLQDVSQSKTLLPPAIRAAKQNDGHIVLLNIIEIPYQLPPSEAEQFILEREVMLLHALDVIKTAGCEGKTMVRISHRLERAIEQIALSMKVDLIVMWAKNSGLLFDRNIYKKIYHIKSNILVANENVESRFDEVILVMDQVHVINSMLCQAQYLLGNENRKIHIIPDFSKKKGKHCYNKMRCAIDLYTRECSVNQSKPDFNVIVNLKEITSNELANTCMLMSVPSKNKSKIRKRLEAHASELDIPIFLLKTGNIEPDGIKQITKQIKQWLGIRLYTVNI